MSNDINYDAIEIIDNFLKLVDIHDKGYEVNVHMSYSEQGKKYFAINVSDPIYKSKTGNTRCYANIESTDLDTVLKALTQCCLGELYV